MCGESGGSDFKMQPRSDVATILIPVSHFRQQWLRSRMIADQSSRFLPRFIYVLLFLGQAVPWCFPLAFLFQRVAHRISAGYALSDWLMWTTRNSESVGLIIVRCSYSDSHSRYCAKHSNHQQCEMFNLTLIQLVYFSGPDADLCLKWFIKIKGWRCV